MQMSPEIANFTPALFWDVDREGLDIAKSRAFIVQRVLERGHDSDWELLKACYTVQGIVETAKQLRSLEPTALAFASCLGKTNKESFRCFTWKQSNPTQFYEVNQIKVDFVTYAYAWLKEASFEEGLRLAQIEDIAAMKLEAVTNRGSKKDFIDVAFLLELFPLAELLRLYQRKYPAGLKLLVMRSLVYFDDADTTEMPVMLKSLS